VKIGDTVIVSRAGDVIPQIKRVIKEMRTGKEKEFIMPLKCPICGDKVLKEGVYYKCSNLKCGAAHRRTLRHFTSKGAFNIEGLGPRIIDRFLDEGLISEASDIFELEEGDIAVLERFGKKSAQNIINEIHARKTILLPKFIYSLGILHVGEETALVLAKKFPISNFQFPIKNFINKYGKLSLEKLQKVPDIGPKVSQSIYDWFRDKRNIKFLENLDKAGVKIRNQKSEVVNQKLANKTFVLTGSLGSISREAAKEKIRDLGGDISESISRKTDYVVVGAEPGSKYKKAKQFGVKIMNENEFLDLIK